MTPLAVANPSAKHVLLLLDKNIQECGSPIFVHPIVNSASVLISSAGLDAFLECVTLLTCTGPVPTCSSCLLLTTCVLSQTKTLLTCLDTCTLPSTRLCLSTTA